MNDLLERAISNYGVKLDLVDLGLIMLLYVSGPQKFDIWKSSEIERLEYLCDTGFLEKDETSYFLYGTGYDEKVLRQQWEAFYKAYKGTRRGVNVEFEHLKKKHRKTWRQIVGLLETAIYRQIEEKEAVKTAIAHQESVGNKKHGLYVAPWKNMQTYINNKAWEEEFPLPEEFRASHLPAQIAPVSAPYQRYYDWASMQVKLFGMSQVLLNTLIFSEKEFMDILTGNAPAFKNFTEYTTVRNLGLMMKEWQESYLRSSLIRQSFASLFDYATDQFRKFKE